MKSVFLTLRLHPSKTDTICDHLQGATDIQEHSNTVSGLREPVKSKLISFEDLALPRISVRVLCLLNVLSFNMFFLTPGQKIRVEKMATKHGCSAYSILSSFLGA